MNWIDEGFLINKNRYSENSLIAELYTKERGKISGIIFGGTSKKIKNYLQIGNKLHINFNSKTVNRIGYLKIEIDQALSPFYFDNKKIDNDNIPEVQKKTGMIFQEFNLVNNLSAINNVLTGLLNTSNKFLSLFYLFKKDQKIEALKSLKTVGLLEKSYNRSDELSGGQRQRVGIARAIIKRPLLLLADEPVASLDPKAANLILSLLKKINKEFGTTILCNLHQVDLAKKYSDRLVGLLDGKIIFDEKSENINKSNLEKIYV